MKIGRLTFLLLLIAVLIETGGRTSGRTLSASASGSDQCLEVTPLIRKLRSPNETIRTTAKESILLLSSRSPESRQCVISAMLRIFVTIPADPEGGFMLAIKSPGLYVQWSEVTSILGTLKANEAMDSLIENLDFNDGKTSFGIGHYPATQALVKFGDPAIPKLEEALQQKPPGIRVMAVKALHAIGGEKARLILLEALKREPDKYVVDTIRNMLLSWNASGSSKT